MEFACEFVYVPPRLRKEDRHGSKKRSALLPPVDRICPRKPPLPPPPPPPPAASNAVENQVRGRPEETSVKSSPFYDNTEPGQNRGTSSSTSASLKQTTAPRKTAPPLPPRPAFMRSTPEYLVLLPSSHSAPPSSLKSSGTLTHAPPPTRSDKEPLPGNPNVVLVSLGKLLSEEGVQLADGAAASCSRCGAVLTSCPEHVVNECYFCRSPGGGGPSLSSPEGPEHGLFMLGPVEKPFDAAKSLLLFCIDVSGSMSITSQVSDGGQVVHRSRLQFVQDAVLQCVKRLSHRRADARVGLITFNHLVTLYGGRGVTSRVLSGAELTDSNYLKEAAGGFPSPSPLSHTRDLLQQQVTALSGRGTTALGPAALVAVAMASSRPGSKVIICTDGKANTGLGNLEVEDTDARTPLSSTIFYQELGEYAASQGVTVSVLSIEGTDCRLDELGRLADRTGGRVVIASPNRLHPEFEHIMDNRTVATHCAVTLLLPRALRVRGEREGEHRASREVGNVNPDTEITFQFGARDTDRVTPLVPGSRVRVQLQIRFRQRNRRELVRVFTATREVTDSSSAALSSLSLAIVQLNSSQASASLAVRGRFLDARREGELQRELIERAIEHNRSADDSETYQQWVKTMEPIYDNIYTFTRRSSVTTDSQTLTDAGAALLYNMKHSNRKSISLKNRRDL